MISSERNNFEKSEKTTDIPTQHPLKNLHVLAKQEKHRPFSPVLGNTSVIKENCSNESEWGVIAYNQKHNMILVKTGDATVSFYDADTLQPLEGRKDLRLGHSLQKFCYSLEIDTYLLLCAKMEVYTYNASTQELERLKHNVKGSLFSITFINPTTYAFVLMAKEIFIKNLENQDTLRFPTKETASNSLQALKTGKFLVSGRIDGSIALYCTDRLPKLPKMCSVQVHQGGERVSKIETAIINHKEYIITSGNRRMNIWHMRKGRMRRLRSMQVQDGLKFFYFVYVEEYKMIAMPFGENTDSVKFISLISGKVGRILDLQMKGAGNIFLMEGKGSIGFLGEKAHQIKIVKLSSVKSEV